MEEDAELPETILYELICCGEWADEREEQASPFLPSSQGAGALSYLNPSKLWRRRRQLSVAESVKWLKGVGPPWQISLSPDGHFVAILQNESLETRNSKDGFTSISGRGVVLKDPNLSSRLLSWNKDSSMIAAAFSNGQIIFYDTLVNQLFSVRRCALPSQEEAMASLFSQENGLVSLFFAHERVKKNAYPNEVVTIDEKGFIKCFRQMAADQISFHHEASLKAYYPKGIYAATFLESQGLLIVSGVLECDNGRGSSNEPCNRFGISAWRLLNDSPFYKITFSVSDELSLPRRRSWKLPFFSDSSVCEEGIFKLVPSPNQKLLACAHTSGSVSIWHLPSLKPFRNWELKSQFHHWTENPRFNNRWRVAFNRWNEEHIDNWRFNPQDLNWWGDNILILSRVNGCLSLFSVDEVVPSMNLLGDSPEIFESPIFLTPKKTRGFLTLECEFKLKMDDRRLANGDFKEELPDLTEAECLEMLDAYDSQFLPKTVIQEVLFWLTEVEKFRPPRKRKKKPPVWHETHRLFLLRNITPQELFHQKIEAEEYGEALDLARAYALDADLVYQRQWSKSKVSVITIRDYLGKIRKRNWVLQECLERIPPSAEAARELLNFGLRGTDLSAAVQISQGKDKGLFQLMTPDDLEISQDEYLLLIDADNLEVKRLLSYRKKFLFFLDILDTYEVMLGGPKMVEENFDGSDYVKLRTRTTVESAIEMARASDSAALRIMLRYHWSQVAPEYLTVLSSFPETTCPHDYSDFLPEVSRDWEVFLWDDYELVEPDWSEKFYENDVSSRRSSAESITNNPGLSVKEVVQWYEERVHEIERFSGITSYALDFARLGVQRNVPGLDKLVKELEVVEIMVYDAKVDMTLEKLEELSPLDRLQTLMAKTTELNFIYHIRNYVMPFLHKCEGQEKGAKFHILNQYLTSISTQDLSLVLLIFENSKPGCEDPIITDVNELMEMAHSCIYTCQNPKQTENILEILNCLPERSGGVVHDNLKSLHERIDDLEMHYQGVKILDKYNIGITLQQLKEKALSTDAKDEEIERLFRNICDTPRTTKPPMKLVEWKNLLYDVLDLQRKVFKYFSSEKCFEFYVDALLRSGVAEIISLARDFIDIQPSGEKEDIDESSDTSPNSYQRLVRRVSSAYSTTFALYLYLLPYNKSLEMVLSAAHHYFDSASNYSDPDIELCKVCLNLMQNPKEDEVSDMFDLIDAVKILNKDFRMNILPQNVRLARSREKLLLQAIEEIPDGYKKIQQLLKLSLFLKLDQAYSQTESWLYEVCGNAALVGKDMKFCVQICESIMAKGYETGWKLFTETAKFQSDPPIIDPDARLAFINYALNMCPDNEILSVLNSKYLIEIRSLQAKVSELSPEDSCLDSSLLDVPETDESVPDSLNPTKLKEFLSTTTSWINPLKNVAAAVTTGTGTLLHPTKLVDLTSRFLKDSQPSDGDETDGSHSILSPDENEPNSSFFLESYPFFYLEEAELRSKYFHPSLLGYKYNSFSSSEGNQSQTIQLCSTLNRIWHCERSLLGPTECGDRDESVLEQLVLEILPEDLPWGLGILFSIDDLSILESILSKVPVTPVSQTIILYFLATMVSTGINPTTENNPNRLIKETKDFITNLKEEEQSELHKLFLLYYEKFQNVRHSKQYKSMELELLGKTNREKVLRIKNIVNMAFPNEKVDELDLVSVTGRKELLIRLISASESLEEFSCLIEILRTSWIDPLDSSAKKNEWVQLLSKMVKSEEGIVHEEIIGVLKQLEDEGKMLDKNCFFYIMGEAKRRQATMLFIRLGFMSKDGKLQIEAAKTLKKSEYEVEDLDEEVLYQLLKRGFLASFLSKRSVYDGLIEVLAQNQGDKSRNWPSIQAVAEQLKNQSHEEEAEELLRQHGSLIPGLLKSALNLGTWNQWGKGSN